MALSVSDLQDLIQLLMDHPEWRAQLRPVILGEELLELPGRMDRVEAALERLADQQARTSAQIAELVQRMDRFDGRLSNIEGGVLETRFSINIPNWTRQWVRRGVRVYIDDIPELVGATSAGKLTEAEVQSLALADSLVRGTDTETGDDTYVSVELSATIHVEDVERAEQRAALLKRAGLKARPVVGGYRISPEGEERARSRGVGVALWRPPS